MNRHPTLITALALALTLAACGDDDPPPQTSAPVEDATDDAAIDDATDDTSDADDATPDVPDPNNNTTVPIVCDNPAPQLGDSPVANALIADASICDQLAFAWRTDSTLGDVTSQGISLEFSATTLQSLADNQGVVPPRPLNYDIAVNQITYTTQDRGELIEASALVAYPTNYDNDDGPLDVFLLLHGTVGLNDACAPSGDFGAQALAALFASYGFMVVAPDYIGLKGLGDPTGFLHPYFVGQATAIASLDAIRAAIKLSPADRGGTCVAPRVLTLGGSQGGHAAFFVDRFAPHYAAELELLGGVATVPPTDLLGQVTLGLSDVVQATGNVIAILAAFADWYQLPLGLTGAFNTPFDGDIPELLAASCDPLDEIDLDNITLEDVFTTELLAAASGGTLSDYAPFGCLIKENGLTTSQLLPTARPDSYGMLFVTGGADQLVDTPTERAAFDDLCTSGDPLVYLECEGASHEDATFFAFPEIMDFIEARQRGDALEAAERCVRTDAVRCAGTP